MCRFRSSYQQKKTVEDLKKGLVDIVIGTHRVLSKDVGFKDLGLLIIDEEQRFGVTHKEKIKKLRENIDVLTLDCHTDPENTAYEPDRDPGYERTRRSTTGPYADPDLCYEYNDEMVREAIERDFPAADRCIMYTTESTTLRMLPDISSSFCRRQMYLLPTDRCGSANWKTLCMIL